MPKPMCCACARFYRPDKNGVYVLEQKPIGPDRVPPGLEAPDKWEPYKIWVADRWRCDGCGSQIVVGWGSTPVSEHYKPDFDDWMSHVAETVNDC